MFSGPTDREDGMAAALKTYGHEVHQVELTEGTDLLDDHTYQKITEKAIAGEWSYVWAAPPCSTFSRLRNHPGVPHP